MYRKLVFFACLALLFITPSHIRAQSEAPSQGTVYIIPVNEEISPFLSVYLKRSLLKAEAGEASYVILELNTFGGRVDSALEITALIGSAHWAKTIAYISTGDGGTGVSWSAGALISFSCDAIYMDAGTSMGAAAPVYQSAEGMVMAEEKVVSAVRGQMAALAEKNGYPPAAALAMVDPDVELYEVEKDGAFHLVSSEELKALEKEEGREDLEGKLISPAGKLLTLTAGEMERYGVSSATVSGRDSLLELLGLSEAVPVILEKSRADWFVAFLSSAAVASILMMTGLVALYLEVTSPGFGIPGTIALICFGLVFASSVLIGNMGSLELLLFLAGAILLLIEVFVIPGFGITGISGIVLMLVALVLSRQNFIIPEFDWQWSLFRRNLLFVSLSLAGALSLIGGLMVALPRSRLFGRLVLNSTSASPGQKGRHETLPAGERDGIVSPGREGSGHSTELAPGMMSSASTDLRPVGKAMFEGKEYIVRTEGEYIEKGETIVVLRREGVNVVVRRG